MSDHHSDGPARAGTDDEPCRTTGAEGPSRDALVERLLDLAVYAPVGVAVTLRDELPRHVKQGRQALENRIQLARFIGQLAVQTGQRELQKRIEQQRTARLEPTDSEPTDSESPTDDVVHGDVAPDESVTDLERTQPSTSQPSTRQPSTRQPSTRQPSEPCDLNDPDRSEAREARGASEGDSDPGPAAGELPISEYESLPAINVVDRLRSMSPDEIELVRRFEQAHRARRTILAKIDQLQERHATE